MGRLAALTTRGAPPLRFTTLTWSAVRKPTDCPSGEKNGCCASSVPSRTRTSNSSRRRTYRRDTPSSSPTYANVVPSGEISKRGLSIPPEARASNAIGAASDRSTVRFALRTRPLASRLSMLLVVLPSQKAAAVAAATRPTPTTPNAGRRSIGTPPRDIETG